MVTITGGKSSVMLTR